MATMSPAGLVAGRAPLMPQTRTLRAYTTASSPALQEHPDRLTHDGLKHAEIYAQYGLTGKRTCWQWMHAEGGWPLAGKGGGDGYEFRAWMVWFFWR